jgi:hypothetical protein
MKPMENSVTFTGACANEIMSWINRSFVYKAKEGLYVRIVDNNLRFVHKNMEHPGIEIRHIVPASKHYHISNEIQLGMWVI